MTASASSGSLAWTWGQRTGLLRIALRMVARSGRGALEGSEERRRMEERGREERREQKRTQQQAGRRQDGAGGPGGHQR